ncbi:MAG: Inhibitor of kappaB kinase gamma-like protein [Verrucomicrobiales bacterium]|nr:Inhibitor of kappaB kinase gamma-like protein [Verrucomicrobiales bacterium]
MTSAKQFKLREKSLAEQLKVVEELNKLVKDIEHCERAIGELKTELEAVNARFPTRNTTRDEIDYLNGLLKVANKKLVWEKNMASLQKRTPDILSRVSQLANDPKAPLDDQAKASLMPSLQAVQAAMERLSATKVG